MVDIDNTPAAPGNDGSWFLDLVVPPAADTENMDNSDAPAAASATTETITETTIEQDALSTWAPVEPEEPKRRWLPWVIAGAVAAVLLVAGAVWLSGSSQREADELADEYTAALVELQAILPQTQQILGVVTDPFTDPATLPSLEPLLSDLEFAADRMLLLATEPLPEPGFLSSSEPFDALAPTRTSMVTLGDEALVIYGRVNDGLAYRVLIDGFMVLPDLPARAAEAQIVELEAELAASLETSERILASLPDDPAFTEHRAIATASLDEYRRWQPPYLEALRLQDDELALALIADIEAVVERVDTSLAPSLARLRSEVDAALLVLNDGITQTIVAIP
jgi:hypothetical protein